MTLTEKDQGFHTESGRLKMPYRMPFSEILRQIELICRGEKVASLYLFGSYAKGTATPYSDIDIVVSGVRNKDRLEKKLDDIGTLKKIDIFYVDDIQDPVLLKEIRQYGRKIYGPAGEFLPEPA